MARSVLAVVAGYLIFGSSAALLFGLSGRDPHAVPSLAFALAAIIYGTAFAAFAGFVAAALAPRKPATHARVVAAIIAVIAMVSLALEFGAGSVWSELATLIVMAPAAVVGGRRRVTRTRAQRSAEAGS